MEKFGVTGVGFKANTKCAGLGGNTSSLAAKKQSAVPKRPVSGVFRGKKQKEIEHTMFKKYYDRRDLPVKIVYAGVNKRLEWKADIELLDYHFYLPIFFHGLQECDEPYKFLVDKGLDDMLSEGRDKILPVLP